MQYELVQYLYMVHRPCRRGKRRAALVVARTAWLHLALLVQALGWTTKGSSSKRTEEEHGDDRTALSVLFGPLKSFFGTLPKDSKRQVPGLEPGTSAISTFMVQLRRVCMSSARHTAPLPDHQPFCGCQSTHGSPKITL